MFAKIIFENITSSFNVYMLLELCNDACSLHLVRTVTVIMRIERVVQVEEITQRPGPPHIVRTLLYILK